MIISLFFAMIVFDLRCEKGHIFEAWFKDSNSFEDQKEKGLLECPICGSHNISKALSPIRYSKSSSTQNKILPKEGPASQEAIMSVLKTAYENIIKNTEDVGTKFATEALKMHYGVSEPRNIRGVATEEEEKMLKKEGVEFFKIPVIPKKGEKGN